MNVKQFLCAGMTGALLVAGLTACAPGAPEVDPSDVAYQTAGVTSQGGNPAGASYHLGMKLQDKDFISLFHNAVELILPVSEYFPVGIHGAHSRVAEGEIKIGKVIHGNITRQLHQRKDLPVLFP